MTLQHLQVHLQSLPYAQWLFGNLHPGDKRMCAASKMDKNLRSQGFNNFCPRCHGSFFAGIRCGIVQSNILGAYTKNNLFTGVRLKPGAKCFRRSDPEAACID